MKKITRLTENDLTRLVKKVIKEEYSKDYNEELEELEFNLDMIQERLESNLGMIQERLEGLVQIIDNDDNLDDDEKEGLIDYAGELYIRCKPKKR
jgi:hypothetical protein